MMITLQDHKVVVNGLTAHINILIENEKNLYNTIQRQEKFIQGLKDENMSQRVKHAEERAKWTIKSTDKKK